MIIIKVMGGLGNQMFQYAIYRRLKEEGQNVKLDLGWTKIYKHPYLIPDVFNVTGDIASYKDARQLGAKSKYRFRRILDYRLGLNKINKKNKNIVNDNNVYVYQNDIETVLKSNEDVYLEGFWQNELWFKGAEDIIREEFTFKRTLDNKGLEILSKLTAPNSIALHYRHYTGENLSTWQRPIEYYYKAVEYFQEEKGNAVFYIFSDNIEWCKKNFNISAAVFIDSAGIKHEERDMRLISHCPNCIISNSTYSWWGAYLNPEKHKKTVISPRVWLNEYSESNPNLSDWITLDVPNVI